MLLAALGAVAVTVELMRLHSTRVRALFVGTVGALLRERELATWSGATWLLVAYALSALVFPRREAVAAMLAAGLGDAAAAIVGRSVSTWRAQRDAQRDARRDAQRGAHATVNRGKTYVGTIACAIVTFVAAWLVAGVSPLAAVAAALAASLIERWEPQRGPHVDDNVRVALAAGAAAWLVASIVTRASHAS